MKSVVVPIPVDGEIDEMITAAAKETGLKKADIMRQGLRHGVPAFVRAIKVASSQNPPKCLEYVDDYPPATIAAKDLKKAIKEKIRTKYLHDTAHR
jgi:hypothetical protein